MNDDSLEDLQLQALEASLADAMPSFTPARQQQLLYACAFAAGCRAGEKKLRLWQGAAASLVLLSFATTASVVRNRDLAPGRERQPVARAAQSHMAILSDPPASHFGRRSTAVALDLRETPPSAELFDEELARFKRLDPQMRALAVRPMTQKLLEQ